MPNGRDAEAVGLRPNSRREPAAHLWQNGYGILQGIGLLPNTRLPSSELLAIRATRFEAPLQHVQPSKPSTVTDMGHLTYWLST